MLQPLTLFLWDEHGIVMEATGGNIKDRYLRGINIVAQQIGNSLNYYLHNMRGDVMQYVDESSSSIHNYEYDAFGNERNPNPNDPNPFRYCGEYWDSSSSAYYLRARNYDPSIGRFTQPDPYWNIHNMQGSIAAILQSGNLYVYAMNNPIRFTDPLGLWTKEVHRKLTQKAMIAIGRFLGQESRFNYHAYHIIRGNLSVDRPPYWAATIGDGGFAQSKHFNRNPAGHEDSRRRWGEDYLELAVGIWLGAEDKYNAGYINFDGRHEQRVQALFYLGRGLHSIQDIDAHLDFGTEYIGHLNYVGIHRVTGESLWAITLGASFIPFFNYVAIFDNPRYEVFRDEDGNWRHRDSGSDFGSSRYTNSLRETRDYLIRFYERIGIW